MKNIYLNNILWLCIDKLFVLGGGLLVTVVVASYLGPDELGKLVFGVSLAGLPVVVSQWGASQTIYNSSVRNTRRSILMITSSTFVRALIFFVVWLSLSLWLFNSEAYNQDALLISLVMFSSIFLGLDIFQFHFNASLSSKVNAKSNMISKSASMATRVIFVLFSVEPKFFVIPYFINNAMLYYLRKIKLGSVESPKSVKRMYSDHFINIGKPFAFTAFCTYLYIKITELMLITFTDYGELAIFNAAMLLAFSWTFVPLAIGISLLHKPMKELSYEEQLKGFSFVNIAMIIISVPVFLIVYFFSFEIIDCTFGVKFVEASPILFVLCLSTLLSTLGVITNRIIGSFDDGGRYLVKKITISSLLAIPVSYALIDDYGILGAAYSVLVIELFNLTIMNYGYKKAYILKMHIYGFSSLRYFKKYN